MSYVELVDFVRNLKGAGASILWVLVLSGRSLTSRQLQLATGYSDKPVTEALAWLEPRGFVQYNGRQHGWSLGVGLQRLTPRFIHSLGPGGDRNISEDRRISDLSLDLDPVVVDPDPSQGEIKQQQHNNAAGVRKDSELAAALRQVGIKGRALMELAGLEELAPAEVTAWYWYARSQPWMTNPAGYVICRLRDGHQPPEGYVALAEAWPGLDELDRKRLQTAVTGVENGVWRCQPAEDGDHVRRRLGDELEELDTTALEAYLELSQAGVQME